MPGENMPLEARGAVDFPVLQEHMSRLKYMREATKANIERARNMQKKYSDRKRRPANIMEGDFVLLEAKTLRL